jgi:predicted GNAT family acetyltransferase
MVTWKVRNQSADVLHYEGKIGHARVAFFVDHRKRIVDLYSVRVPVAHRGKGEAQRALDAVLAVADGHKYDTTLLASPLDRRTRVNDLERLYAKKGFFPTGRRLNAAGDREMIRPARDQRRTRRTRR